MAKPEFPDELFGGMSGFEIDGDSRFRHGTQLRAELIDGAAFQTVAGDEQLSDGGDASRGGRDVLEWFTFGFFLQRGGPGCFPAGVGRHQRSDRDSQLFE